MTKREICERLMEIRDQSSAGHLGPVGIRDALRDLILDLAAPDEHFASVGKMMEKRREEEMPPLFTYTGEDQKRPCPQCGQLCVRDMVSGNWWCRTHGSFKPKRGEEEKDA